MYEQKTAQKRTHDLIMKNRDNLEISGVYDVEGFDEKEINCFTDFGQLIIRGERLHVENMDTSSGQMKITGQVSALIYTAEKRHSSFVSKLFK